MEVLWLKAGSFGRYVVDFPEAKRVPLHRQSAVALSEGAVNGAPLVRERTLENVSFLTAPRVLRQLRYASERLA
jgi:hypothetical protein